MEYTFGVRIEGLPSAWQHSITAAEIRAVISYPLLRYTITTVAHPEAATYMFVARVNNEPWIEVAAEDDGDRWLIFHAMPLTARVAREIYTLSAGTIDLRDDIAPPRPHIGPQDRPEEI